MDIHEEKIIREEKKPKDDRRWREDRRCWLPYIGGLLLFLAGIGFSQLFMLVGSGLSEPQNIVVAFKNPVCTAPTIINCPKQHPQMRPMRENAEVVPPRSECRCPNMPPVTNKGCCGPQASVWPEQPQGAENLLHLRKHGRTA